MFIPNNHDKAKAFEHEQKRGVLRQELDDAIAVVIEMLMKSEVPNKNLVCRGVISTFLDYEAISRAIKLSEATPDMIVDPNWKSRLAEAEKDLGCMKTLPVDLRAVDKVLFCIELYNTHVLNAHIEMMKEFSEGVPEYFKLDTSDSKFN